MIQTKTWAARIPSPGRPPNSPVSVFALPPTASYLAKIRAPRGSCSQFAMTACDGTRRFRLPPFRGTRFDTLRRQCPA